MHRRTIYKESVKFRKLATVTAQKISFWIMHPISYKGSVFSRNQHTQKNNLFMGKIIFEINLYNPYLLVRYAICSLSFDESSAIVVSVRLLMTSRRLVTGIPIFWFCTRTLTEYFCFLRYLLRLVEHVVFFQCLCDLNFKSAI